MFQPSLGAQTQAPWVNMMADGAVFEKRRQSNNAFYPSTAQLAFEVWYATLLVCDAQAIEETTLWCD